MQRMHASAREHLLGESLTWPDIQALAEQFIREYESAAVAAAATPELAEAQLPFLSPTGLWLQSYGFSKACLGGYCQVVARRCPSVLSVACSPGFVQTDMASTYSGDIKLKSIDEGGETPAWLATSNRESLQTGTFYQPDRSVVGWVAE